MAKNGKWVVALTGASGMRYGLRLLQVASKLVNELHVVISEAGLRVLNDEDGVKCSFAKLSPTALFGEQRENVFFYNPNNIGATIASGSMLCEGMVVIPCSMSTLAAIATGNSQNLVHRAADVTLKEGRKLIIVPRETPLSAIHLEHMLKLARLGVSVVPAMPGFYHQPQSVQEIVDMLVMKVLDQMGIESSLVRRWGEQQVALPEHRRTERLSHESSVAIGGEPPARAEAALVAPHRVKG